MSGPAATGSDDPATTKPSDEILHQTAITPMQAVILVIIMAASMLDGFDVVVISYAAPAISQEWGISPEKLGVVLSAGLFGMMLGAMFLSWMADRYGRRVTVSSALAIAGLATCGVNLADSVVQLVALRVTAGLALGLLVATLPVLIGEFSPLRHRTLSISLLVAAGALGAVVGGYVAAALIADHGWRRIFLYAGLVTLVIGALIQTLVPESIALIVRQRPPGALQIVNRTLKYMGQSAIEALPPIRETTTRDSATVAALFTPARGPTTMLSWSSFFTGFLVLYFVLSWMPKVLTDAGLPQAQAIQVTSLIPFGSMIGTTLIGWLGRRWPLNRVVAVGCVVGSAFILVLSSLLDDLTKLPLALISALAFLIGLSLIGAFSNLYTLASTIYPVQIRGTGIGWCVGLGRAGAVVSPTAAGVLIGFGMGMPALFALFTVPAVATALTVSLVRVRELP